MKDDRTCCCPSPIPSRETTHFYLLGVLIALYMLAGAAVFSSLERPAEIRARLLWESRLAHFSHEHKISGDDLKKLLQYYEEARTAGIRTEDARTLWDMSGAFYFVGTVVSTIGFGVTAPSTLPGKVLLVFYGLLGCSATILFFNLFLERVISLLSFHVAWCWRRRRRRRDGAGGGERGGEGGGERHSGQEGAGAESDRGEERKPSVYQVTLILFVAVLMVAFAAAFLYSAMEGWSYTESLYFCFVAFSTVGFGDFVSGQRAHHEDTVGYQVANCLLMLLGVCCTYSLFNAVSVIIKQGLNRILTALSWIHQRIGRQHVRPHSKLRSTASREAICRPDDESQAPTISTSGPGVLWQCCPHGTAPKCRCDETAVEIVCHKEDIVGLKIKGVNAGDDVSVRQLPVCLD